MGSFTAVCLIIGVIGLIGYFAVKDDDPKPKSYGYFILMAAFGLGLAFFAAGDAIFN